jgi:M6 family metalloprotease-like protein
MKKTAVLLFCFAISALLCAQDAEFYAPNGGIFTPKGDLRVLLVFVTFKDGAPTNPNFRNEQQKMQGWDVSPNTTYRLPNSVDTLTGSCSEFMFSTQMDFVQKIDSVNYNFSKEYYMMSKGNFRLMGEVFRDSLGRAASIEIDPEGCGWWSQCNRKAWEEMQRLNPKMDWSRFDSRRNSPQFRFDNSDTATYKPDKILDYVVFVYRYQLDWAQPPVWGMHKWAGAGGGVASTGLGVDKNASGYSCREGFTMCYNSGVFIHEVAHTLYNMPHIFGTNKVSGDYFYLPSVGWGATSMIAIFRGGFTAWERWYLGYIDWVADLKAEEKPDPNKIYTFTLRDYVTQGDAARIAIPHSEGQYLYLENHTGVHRFDRHIWQGNQIGADTVGQTPTGLYMYVSTLPDTRQTSVQPLSNKANSVRLLNANGNFDYYLADSTAAATRNAWGNEVFEFVRGAANPLGGLNPYYFYPVDKDKDGKLNIDRNYNQGKFEAAMILREKLGDSVSHDFNSAFGTYSEQGFMSKNAENYYRNPAFQSGDSLTICTNPTIINHPTYNVAKESLEPFVLNGIWLKIGRVSLSGDLHIGVKFGQTELARSVRWTGNIILPNISSDTLADLRIMPRRELHLDRSKTPNRHTAGKNGDFVNPTQLVVRAGATLELMPRSVLYLSHDSELNIAAGGKLILHKKAKIYARKGAKLSIEAGATVQKHKKAKIIAD